METKLFLNRYRLSLGRNGTPVEFHRTSVSVTYRAQEIDSGREVALELVPWRAPDPLLRERFEAEAMAAQEINHINIPLLHDFGFQNDQLVYVTEYFDGHTAEAWLGARGPLPVSAVVRVALQITSALGAAAFHRIHHHALHPGNILFVAGQTTDGGWPPIKVLHWLGPAPAFSPAAAPEEQFADAARFASPEQLRGEEVDFRSEIYSLGCTMWYLLTASAPAATGAALGEKFPQTPAAKVRGVPKIVRHLIARMLRADPAERPQDPVVLAAYLQTCLARVERREAIGRRLGIASLARARVIEKSTRRPVGVKGLALAAVLLACASLAALLLPGHFFGSHSWRGSQVASSRAPNESAAPVNKTAVANPAASLARETSTPAASSESEVPRDELAANPPIGQSKSARTEPPVPAEGPGEVVAVASASPSSEAPDEISTAAPAETPNEIAVALPAQPPNEVASASPNATTKEVPDEMASAPATFTPNGKSITQPTETGLPGDATTDVAEAPSLIPHDNAPRVAADAATVSPSPSSAPGNATNSISARLRDKKTTSPTSVASDSRTKARSTAKRSRTRSETHSRKQATIAKGAKIGHAIPPLHVGSTSAHLVGKTADGMWILSVASTGRQIIVPPPPGYQE